MTADQKTFEGDVLVLNVGAGNKANLEATLYQPILKSVEAGSYEQVILLPSSETRPEAEEIARRLGALPCKIVPLQKGTEDDVGRCFDQYQKVLSDLRAAGYDSLQLVCDFTRGTKAMSAALVLAASSQNVSRLRYVTGLRGPDGLVIAGQEAPRDFDTRLIDAHRIARDVQLLASKNVMTGARTLLGEPDSLKANGAPDLHRSIAEIAYPLLRYYEAWDAFDYAQAHALHDEIDPKNVPHSSPWRRAFPTSETRAHVTLLAGALSPVVRARAQYFRVLAGDVMANAERRLDEGRYEDANLRAYRLFELFGQLRLAQHGIEASYVKDKKLIESGVCSTSQRGAFQIPRFKLHEALAVLNDDFQYDMHAINQLPLFNQRNESVLIHGTHAVGVESANEIQVLLGNLDAMYLRESQDYKKARDVGRSFANIEDPS